MPPTVAEAITHGRRAITQLEPTILADLLRSYEQVWWQTERTIMQYESQIQAAIDAGQTVKPSWVRQQTWYRQVQGSIDDQFVRFNHTALSTIVRGQSQAVGIAGESTALFRQAVGIETSLAGRVNAGAFERWVIAVQPNSPIRGVIEKYGDRVRDSLLKRMSEGLGSGQGVGSIVRSVERDIGTDAVGGRLQTLTRSEVLRSYRGANQDSMTEIGETLPGTHEWEWLAALGPRTCLSCISYHRRRFPFDQYPNRFHPACRCSVFLRVDRSLVPAMGRPPETGVEWFARQSEEDQRKILPSRAHHELFQQGVPLEQMVTIRSSPVWGESLAIRPASTLQVGGR